MWASGQVQRSPPPRLRPHDPSNAATSTSRTALPLQGTSTSPVGGEASSARQLIRLRASMPAKLDIFKHIVSRGNQPKGDVMRTGFRMLIPVNVPTDDLGLSSCCKDGDIVLWDAAESDLVVPSAGADSLLHINCSAHNHLGGNERKSHLKTSSNIKKIHQDINKLDRHLVIPSLRKYALKTMLTKWRKEYREKEFSVRMSTYYDYTGGATPRAFTNLIGPARAGNPSANNGGS